jgi:hypothetical protein
MLRESQKKCLEKPLNLKYLKRFEENCRASSPAHTQPDAGQF